MIKWALSQGCKDSIYTKSINAIYHINKLKDKNHMIISIDAKKAFNKIQHTFMIFKKSPLKLNIEGSHLNIIKAIHEKHCQQTLFSTEKN